MGLRQKLKKLGPKYFAEMKYPEFLELPIEEHAVLLESQQGRGIDGNIYYIAERFMTDEKYSDFKVYISAGNKSVKTKVMALIRKCGAENRAAIVETSKSKYMKALATSQYLFNDNTFLTYFIKREGQTYINVGHGTPLKTLGRYDRANCHTIGNVQKNYFFADYFLCPNEFTAEAQRVDYMMDNLSNARMLLGGYPRNAIFFDEESRARIREKYDIQDKTVYAYMPTWRHTRFLPTIDDKDSITTDYKEYVKKEKARIKETYTFSEITNMWLSELDELLGDDEILFVKAHLLEHDKFGVDAYKHIRMFPTEDETYEFLGACDELITDYSSVFYDFAVTGRKVVLFTYDEEQYLETRGLHMPLTELPFPRTYTPTELINELRGPKNYDDTEFLDEYCAWDNINATAELLDRVIDVDPEAEAALPEETFVEGRRREYACPNNGKKNVLMFIGDFAPNGVTSSLKGLLSNIDTSRHNYYLNFQGTSLNLYKANLNNLPPEVRYVSRVGKMSITLKQNIYMRLYNHKLISLEKFWNVMKPAYERDIVRQFAHNKFDVAVQFTGYEYKKIMMYSLLDAKKYIFVHSDMIRESRIRHNQRLDVLKYAYQMYDGVVAVTEGMIAPTMEIAEGKCSPVVIENLINVNGIHERAENEVAFSRFTVSNVTHARFQEILNSDAMKFVNLGRYSPEKGHDRLVRAFNRYWKENPDAYLIIVGGNQMKQGYRDLKRIVDKLDARDNIVMIKGGCDPYPVVRQCDGLLLSSYYEGFGLVLAEADMLGVPVVSVDIDGPRAFMRENNGVLVDNSEDGLLDGMRLLADGKVELLNADYSAVNEKSAEKFEKLIESN